MNETQTSVRGTVTASSRARFTLDPLAARAHRAHHADPRDPRHRLTPARVVFELVVVAWLATRWLPAPLDATALPSSPSPSPRNGPTSCCTAPTTR